MAFTPDQALIESAGKINTEDFGRRVRVHSVAKQLGITSKEFIGILDEFGHSGKAPSSTLSKEEASHVVASLAGAEPQAAAQAAAEGEAEPKAKKPAAKKKTVKKSAAKKAPAKKAAAGKSAATEDAKTAQSEQAPAEKTAAVEGAEAEGKPEQEPKSSAKKAQSKKSEPKKSQSKKADTKKSEPKKAEPQDTQPNKGEEKKAAAKKEKPKKGAEGNAAGEAADKGAEKKQPQEKQAAQQKQNKQQKAEPQEQPEADKQTAGTADVQASSNEKEEEKKPGRRRVRRVVRRVGSRAIQTNASQGEKQVKAEQEAGDKAEKRDEKKNRDKAAGQDQAKSQDKAREKNRKDQGKNQGNQGGEQQDAQHEDEVSQDQLHPGDRGEGEIVDEPVRLKGSTRLESKRRWREENRERGRKKVISRSEFLARRESVHRQMMVRDSERHDHNGLTTQVGVVEDGQLVEHFVTSDTQQSMIGNIYLGRVQNVLASMEAAFIDIGMGRNAVLYASEVNWHSPHLHSKSRRIEQALRSGDQVMVQVIKDPVGHKGARLTNRISFAGRYLVYFPGGTTAGISRKLPEPERKRLKEILQRVVPGQGGAIIRTAAENVAEDLIEEDVNRLHKQWLKIEEIEAKERKSKGAKPVTLYEEPNMLITVIRDLFNEDFSELLVEGDKSWRMVRDYMGRMAPELMDRVHKWHPEQHADEDVFAAHRLDDQLAKALSRKVWLPSGGHLVIDHTEAMTVIDVNTGSFVGSGGNLEETVTENNLEAAEEIVRQMRLRDIGGMIVVDFIDMVLEENQDLVLRRLIEYLGRDRTHHKVSEVTSLGLVQITRKRLGAGLLETFSTTCECCGGRGVIVHPDPVEQDINAEPEHRRRRSGGQDRDREDRGRGGHGRHGKGQGNGHGNGKSHEKGNGKPEAENRGKGREEHSGDKSQENKGRSHKDEQRRGRNGRGKQSEEQHANEQRGADQHGAGSRGEQQGGGKHGDQQAEDKPQRGRRRRRVVSRRSSTGSSSGSSSRGSDRGSQQGEKQRGEDRRSARRSSSSSQDAAARGQRGSGDQAQPTSGSGKGGEDTQQRAPRRVVRRRIVRRTSPGKARADERQREASQKADAPELNVSHRGKRAAETAGENSGEQSRAQGSGAPRRRGRRVVRSAPAARRGGAGQAGGQSRRAAGKEDEQKGQSSQATRRTRGVGTYAEAVKEFENSPRRRRRTRGNSVSDHRPRPEDFGEQPGAGSDSASGSSRGKGKASAEGSDTASGNAAGKASGNGGSSQRGNAGRGRRRRVVRSSSRR